MWVRAELTNFNKSIVVVKCSLQESTCCTLYNILVWNAAKTELTDWLTESSLYKAEMYVITNYIVHFIWQNQGMLKTTHAQLYRLINK